MTAEHLIRKATFPKKDELERMRTTVTPPIRSLVGVPLVCRVMTLTETPPASRHEATLPTSLAVPSRDGGKAEVTMRTLGFSDLP